MGEDDAGVVVVVWVGNYQKIQSPSPAVSKDRKEDQKKTED